MTPLTELKALVKSCAARYGFEGIGLAPDKAAGCALSDQYIGRGKQFRGLIDPQICVQCQTSGPPDISRNPYLKARIMFDCETNMESLHVRPRMKRKGVTHEDMFASLDELGLGKLELLKRAFWLRQHGIIKYDAKEAGEGNTTVESLIEQFQLPTEITQEQADEIGRFCELNRITDWGRASIREDMFQTL